MQYVPEKVYEDEDGNVRIFDEMWTGEWWWNLQVSTLNMGRRKCMNSLENLETSVRRSNHGTCYHRI
jgi:hypothetical protein